MKKSPNYSEIGILDVLITYEGVSTGKTPKVYTVTDKLPLSKQLELTEVNVENSTLNRGKIIKPYSDALGNFGRFWSVSMDEYEELTNGHNSASGITNFIKEFM
jgi:hypothetical protein